MIYLTQKFKLSGVHRHHNPELSGAENEKLFHKCAKPHGHEYRVEVTLQGSIATNGLLEPRMKLKKVMDEILLKPMAGHYLNEFMGNTSGEIIAQNFFNRLHNVLGESLVRVTVRETRKNSFYFADSKGPQKVA